MYLTLQVQPLEINWIFFKKWKRPQPMPDSVRYTMTQAATLALLIDVTLTATLTPYTYVKNVPSLKDSASTPLNGTFNMFQ